MTGKIKVAREALLPALSLAAKATERKSTIPILQNLLVAVEPDRLSLTGSDLDSEIRASAPCEAGQASSFTLPAGLFNDAVRKLPEGVDVLIDAETNFANVTAGKSRFRMPLLPAGDFPLMNASDYSHSFTLPAATIATILANVSFAISTEETRYYLNGIHMHGGERLTAVTTDGHRLARYHLPLPPGADGMPTIIIPRRAVNLIKSMIGEKGDVRVSLSGTKILFETDAGALTSKLIDGTFPDYQRVIPTGNGNRFGVDRASLHAAIDRVTTISSGKGSAVKFGFGADEEELRLAANNPDAGSADETLVLARLGGDPVEIGFNGRYCLDMLSAIAGERVVFELGDPGSPAIIRPEGDDPERPLFVLMPMRV